MDTGGPSRMMIAPDEALLQSREYEVLAVRVVNVDAQGATNGHPPTVELEVLAALRGKAHRRSIRATWEAPIDPAVADEDGTRPTHPELIDKWLAQPYAGPRTGEELIVLVEPRPDGAA